MKKINSKFYLLFLLAFLPLQNVLAQSNIVDLPVPFTSEIPNGTWTKPWNNACEEASIIMAEGYYYGYTGLIPKTTAMKNMAPLFKIEDKIFGSNADSDAARTAKLINNYTDFSATIVDDPTLDDIKNELIAGRPVISFHYAKDLKNKNHRWRVGGSYYHVMVIVGYDDDTQEFIFNDSGDVQTGNKYRYTYGAVMASLHDFDFTTHHADGPARVLFTSSKLLYKEKNSPAVYLISHDTKFPIASSEVFLNHGWQWKQIHVVDKNTLNKFKTGDLLDS